MFIDYLHLLSPEEIRALAQKWWGNSVLPPHYLDALREAAWLGAARAAQLENRAPRGSAGVGSGEPGASQHERADDHHEDEQRHRVLEKAVDEPA